jgi:hypothetical protein
LALEVFPNDLGLLAAHLNLPLIVVVVLYLMAAPLHLNYLESGLDNVDVVHLALTFHGMWKRSF